LRNITDVFVESSSVLESLLIIDWNAKILLDE